MPNQLNQDRPMKLIMEYWNNFQQETQKNDKILNEQMLLTESWSLFWATTRTAARKRGAVILKTAKDAPGWLVRKIKGSIRRVKGGKGQPNLPIAGAEEWGMLVKTLGAKGPGGWKVGSSTVEREMLASLKAQQITIDGLMKAFVDAGLTAKKMSKLQKVGTFLGATTGAGALFALAHETIGFYIWPWMHGQEGGTYVAKKGEPGTSPPSIVQQHDYGVATTDEEKAFCAKAIEDGQIGPEGAVISFEDRTLFCPGTEIGYQAEEATQNEKVLATAVNDAADKLIKVGKYLMFKFEEYEKHCAGVKDVRRGEMTVAPEQVEMCKELEDCVSEHGTFEGECKKVIDAAVLETNRIFQKAGHKIGAAPVVRKAPEKKTGPRPTPGKYYISNATKKQWKKRVVEASSKHLIIVYFWADWCVPCHKLAPILKELTSKYGGTVHVVKIKLPGRGFAQNTPANHLHNMYSKNGLLPFLVAFKDGKERGTWDTERGTVSEKSVKDFIDGAMPALEAEPVPAIAPGGEKAGSRWDPDAPPP